MWRINVLRYYLMDCDDHVGKSRREIYNVLE